MLRDLPIILLEPSENKHQLPGDRLDHHIRAADEIRGGARNEGADDGYNASEQAEFPPEGR